MDRAASSAEACPDVDGHHSIQVTFDTYGHLFAALEEDAAIMFALEAGVMGGGGDEVAA